MVEPLRHRQTKEAETDMFDLKPPRHTSDSTVSADPNSAPGPPDVRYAPKATKMVQRRDWSLCAKALNRCAIAR